MMIYTGGEHTENVIPRLSVSHDYIT